MSNIGEQKKVYDTIYQEIKNYNFRDPLKDNYVDKFAELIGKDKSFIDLGCGEGANLRRLIGLGYNAEGVEISQVCCENFLADLPHYNSDIVSFAKLGKKYDAAISMDVLEHIPFPDISKVISSVADISSNAFLGIANHSDVLNGVELHLIRENSSWWQSTLSKSFKHVLLINEMQYGAGENIFFMFFCSNDNQVVKDLNSYFCKEIIESLKYDISLVNKVKTTLQNEVSTVKEINISLQSEMVQTNAANVDLRDEIHRVNKVFQVETSRLNEVFQIETSRLNKHSANLQNELSRENEVNANLQNELSRASEINTNLQNELSRISAINQSINEITINMKVELERLRHELSSLENTKAVKFARNIRKVLK